MNQTITSSGPLIGIQTSPRTALSFGTQGVQLTSLEDAWRFAQYVVASGLAPRGLEKPEAILIAMQLGAELGLTPMASLQNIAVINGRPGIFGDAALALVRGSGLVEDHKEEPIGTPGTDAYGYRVTTKRRGMSEHSDTFTVADAKLAKLWGKSGPWTDYPKRMLKWRARGFVLRDIYGDVLKGLRTAEEIQDLPAEKNITPMRGLAEALDKPAEKSQEPPIPFADPLHELISKNPPAPIPAKPADEGERFEDAVPVKPVATSKPRSAKPPLAENRIGAITALEIEMLNHSVPEARLWKYAQDGWPEACDAAGKLFNLPTHILTEMKDVVADLAKK